MLPIDHGNQPPIKKGKTNMEFSLETYPVDMIIQFIYFGIKEENRTASGYKSDFACLVFDNCHCVNRKWRKCSEYAAINFANSFNFYGFNFLRCICKTNESMLALVVKRGREIHGYVNLYADGGTDRGELFSKMVSAMPNLEKILISTDTDGVDFKGTFESCQKIRACWIYGDAPKEAYSALANKLPKLSHLTLECSNLDDECLAALSRLSQLEELILDGGAISEEGFKCISRNLPCLKSLTLNLLRNVYFDMDAICKHHPDLEKLTISGILLDHAYIPPKFNFTDLAASLPNLKHFSVYSIGERDLFEIAKGLPNLEYLRLCDCEVSDLALTAFAALRKKRIQIELNGTQTSAEWCRELQRLFPYVQIERREREL